MCRNWHSLLFHSYHLKWENYAYYIVIDWYKSLWKVTFKSIYYLDLLEDYPDMLLLLRGKAIYVLQTFVGNRFHSSNFKCLNFVCKHIQAVSLVDITTVDGRYISQQVFEVQLSIMDWGMILTGLDHILFFHQYSFIYENRLSPIILWT